MINLFHCLFVLVTHFGRFFRVFEKNQDPFCAFPSEQERSLKFYLMNYFFHLNSKISFVDLLGIFHSLSDSLAYSLQLISSKKNVYVRNHSKNVPFFSLSKGKFLQLRIQGKRYLRLFFRKRFFQCALFFKEKTKTNVLQNNYEKRLLKLQ